MPRRPPDQIITHRIELGGWEREQVKDVKSTLVLTGVAVSAAALASAAAIAVTAYATFWSLKKLYGWGDEALDAAKTTATGAWDWYWGPDFPSTKYGMQALEWLGLMKTPDAPTPPTEAELAWMEQFADIGPQHKPESVTTEEIAWTPERPENPEPGDTWWNPDLAALFYWDGHAWMYM